jgi:threonine synthase
MGLPIDKLVIATNENDILHRFWQSGTYEKHTASEDEAAHQDGAKETLSPAMDILISSNFERLLWFLTYRTWKVDSATEAERQTHAGVKVKGWLEGLKNRGFTVEPEIIQLARQEFESERVSDEQIVDTILDVFGWPGVEQAGKFASGYILDPHSAVGVYAALRSVERTDTQTIHVSLSTAHPAKFSKAVELALSEVKGFQFNSVLPPQFVGLESLPRKVIHVKKDSGLDGVRKTVVDQVNAELQGSH